jgi:hypothetical protein
MQLLKIPEKPSETMRRLAKCIRGSKMPEIQAFLSFSAVEKFKFPS